MATISRSRLDNDERSAGGKIVRKRRERPTPYSRPMIPQAVDSADVERNFGNPKYWLSGLMLPAKMIATGAGKIFSTVFAADSESSSSSSENEDSACESDDKEEDVVVSLHDQLKEVAPSSIGNSENKHLIQQLITHEAFSSEEGEELIRLIKSRIVNDGGSLRNIETETTSHTRAAAIMEAKKWLEEKKSGSALKPKLNDQFHASEQAPFLEDDIGSPVDVAKSYMQSRSAWSSPSTKHIEFSTPSTAHSSKEEKFKSIFPNSIQLSETRRSSLLSGSWNILEEIRRVRSKATEELLATTPSKKDDRLTSPEGKSDEGEPITEMRNEGTTGDQLYNLASTLHAENMQVEPDGLHSEARPANGNSSAFDLYKDGETVPVAEDALVNADPDVNSKQLDGRTLLKKSDESRDYAAQNGFPSGASSFSVGEDHRNNYESLDLEMADAKHSTIINIDPSDHPAENTVLQEPASPTFPSVSQNSSSMQNEEGRQARSGRSTPKRKAAVVAELKGAAQVKSKPRKGRAKRKDEEVKWLPN